MCLKNLCTFVCTSLFNIFSYCFCTFAKCYCNMTNNYSNFCVISSVYMHVHTNGYIIRFPCKIHAQNVWQWRVKSGHKDWLIATMFINQSRYLWNNWNNICRDDICTSVQPSSNTVDSSFKIPCRLSLEFLCFLRRKKSADVKMYMNS